MVDAGIFAYDAVCLGLGKIAVDLDLGLMALHVLRDTYAAFLLRGSVTRGPGRLFDKRDHGNGNRDHNDEREDVLIKALIKGGENQKDADDKADPCSALLFLVFIFHIRLPSVLHRRLTFYPS